LSIVTRLLLNRKSPIASGYASFSGEVLTLPRIVAIADGVINLKEDIKNAIDSKIDPEDISAGATSTTLDAGSNATATAAWDAANKKINFTFGIPKGATGEQGIQGEKGNDGHSPVITIQGGYWYIDGVNTNVKAEGVDGSDASIVVDAELSEISENPVQNKVINAALATMKASIDELFNSASPTFDHVVFKFERANPDGEPEEHLVVYSGNVICDDLCLVNDEVPITWYLKSIEYKATGVNKCDSTLTLRERLTNEEHIMARDIIMQKEGNIDVGICCNPTIDETIERIYKLEGTNGNGLPFSTGVRIRFVYPYYYGALSKDADLGLDDFETLTRRFISTAIGDKVRVNVTETDNYIWVLSTEHITGVKCSGFESKLFDMGTLYNANGVEFNCYRAQKALQAGNYDISFY
jgi:hypothetical protein